MVTTLLVQLSKRLIEIEQIKHVDEYGGPTYLDKNVAVAYPLVFIEIRPLTWQHRGTNLTSCDAQVKFYVLKEIVGNTYLNDRNKSDDKVQNLFDFYNLAPLLHNYLQDFKPNPDEFYEFGKLNRVASQSESYPVANLRLFTMTYELLIVDKSKTIQKIQDLFPTTVDFEDEIDFVEEGMPNADGL